MDEFSYGLYIKTLRKDLNLTRKEACEKLTISVQTLTRIESDKVSISLSVLEELIHLFNVDVSAFLAKKVYCNKQLFLTSKFKGETLKKNLVFLRNRKQYSQTQLANKIGVSNNKISLWENGKSMPNLIEFKNLCLALEIDPDDFYFDKVIPEKRIVKFFEAPSEKFIKIFSTMALGVILCGIGSFNVAHYNNHLFLPPENQIQGGSVENNTAPIKKYKVTYRYEMIDNVITKEFNEGSKVPFLPLPVALEGYQLVDYTYLNESFDFENYRLNQDITLYGDLEKKSYRVTYFADDKETILKQLDVPYLESATPPSIDDVDIFDDKKFIRWSENTNKVTKDLNVYPLYDYYESRITFYDANGINYEPIENYSHSSYGLLPKPPSDFSSTFIGWFYNDRPFTADTPLDKEMHLVSKYLPKDVVGCSIKHPEGLEVWRNCYVAGYNLQFLSGYIYDNMLATRFKMNDKLVEYPIVFDNNEILLDPIFDNYIEYSIDKDGSIIIEELRSDQNEVYIPNIINGVNVSQIKDGALLLPNCTKLVIGAGNIHFGNDLFTKCENIEELYIKDLKTWNETISLPDDFLKPLKKLRVLELPLAIDYNNDPININKIGVDADVKGLTFLALNDFDFRYFFKNATQNLLDKISFIKVESVNEYPFNRRVEMGEVDLSKFNNLKKLDFIGTINEIHLLNASKSKANISYNSDLEQLFLGNNDLNQKGIKEEFKVVNKRNLVLYGNDQFYANRIKLDTLKSLNFYDDVKFYPLEEIYLPEFFNINANGKTRIINKVKGHKVNVYIKGKLPQLNELQTLFEGSSDNLDESFNFISF